MATTTLANVLSVLQCPSAPSRRVFFGVTQRQVSQPGGLVYAISMEPSITRSFFLGSVAGSIPLSSSSPNSVAFDIESGALYMASFTTFSTLYQFNVTTGALVLVGNLTERAAGATFYNGSYWYAVPRSDTLRRVRLSANGGEIITDEFVAHMNANTSQDYGDIDFDANGLLHVSATIVSSGARMYATYDLGRQLLTLVANGTSGDPQQYGQVAIGSDGMLYNHNSANGRWSVLLSSGALVSSGVVTPGFTDIAAFKCADWFANPPGTAPASTSTLAASTMTSTAAPSTLSTTTATTATTQPACVPTFYGISSRAGTQSGGVVFRVMNSGAGWSVTALLNLSSMPAASNPENLSIAVTSSGPNGVAFDAANSRLYFGSLDFAFESSSLLYVMTVPGLVVRLAGQAAARTSNAAFYNGKYYYVAAHTDSIRAVTLSSVDGTIVSDDLMVASFSGGQFVFDFGDIDIRPDGRVFMVTTATNATLGFVSRQLATVDLSAATYHVIFSQNNTPYTLPVSTYSQLGFDFRGVLYNHDAATGRWMTLSATTGQITSAVLLTTQRMGDIASVECNSPTTSTSPPASATVSPATNSSTAVLSTTSPCSCPAFSPSRVIDGSATSGPWAVTTGLVNADSFVDIVVADNDAGAVRLYLGVGNGQFQPGIVVYRVASHRFRSVRLADFDGDGRLDIVSANSLRPGGSVLWFRNTGNMSNFVMGVVAQNIGFPVGVAVGDFNGDGSPDVVVAQRDDNAVVLYINNMNGASFSAVWNSTVQVGTLFMNLADVTGDGLLDMVVASRLDNRFVLYRRLNVSGFSFNTTNVSSSSLDARAVAIADFDRDGLLDVAAVSNFDSKVSVFKNLGGGLSWSELVVSSTLVNPVAIAVADVDNDGLPELFVSATNGGSLAMFRNSNNGQTFTQTSLASSGDGRALDVADLDGDGKTDVVWVAQLSNFVAWVPNACCL
jgi:hypothetical protein